MVNFNYSLEPGKNKNIVKEYIGYKKVISIITPAWNPTEYLFQTANCILNQTYPYFEWVIVDDGSTKKESLEILKQVEAMDDRIKVFHKKNEGLSKTRDYGVKHSSKETDIVVFIDDDDLLDKTYLECAYYTLCANAGASWAYCDVVNFEGEENLWNKKFSSSHMKYENLLVSQAMVRKSAFYDVGGFALDGNGHYEDWIFWLKLMAKGHYPVHMSFYGFWYRRKKVSGQLKLAASRHSKNMKEIAMYANKIEKPIYPIEYPREDYNWDGITEKINTVVFPEFKNDKKTHIMVMVPWMTLGGADKFNLDLFKMIDKNKYSVTLISMQPTEYVWRQQFEEACDEVFDLSTFISRKDWLSFVNYIIETRHIDIIFNTNSVTGYMMLPYLHAKYPDLPILDYVHMEEWYNRNGGYSRDSAAVGSAIDKTLFCNKNSENILVDYFGRTRESVGTVYIGVDADKFDPDKYDKEALRKKYHIETDQFVISVIARIDYQKRPILLMRIIKETIAKNKIKNPMFVIAGDGPLLEKIQQIASKDSTAKYIKFIGKTSSPDEIYAISDMTLNCSIKEGLALTSYESLSMGVPVVSADVGGQKELINKDTGVIVPCMQKESEIHNFNYKQEEIMAYVDGILKIYKNSNQYKQACRKRILDDFTIQNMVVNMQQEFDKLTKVKHKKTTLMEHTDILKELLNQYLVADQSLYKWLCNEYDSKVYGEVEVLGRSERIQKFIYTWKRLGLKLHMPIEFDIIMYNGYDILRYGKNFICSFIGIFVSSAKLIAKLFLHLGVRICNVVKKVFSHN